MPIPKRWFPVSRDFNHDPELWELADLYGDRSLRIWLELLGWADKTENHIPLSSHWVASLAQVTKTNLKTVVQVVAWMLDRGWLVIQGDPNVAGRWIEILHHLCRDWPKTHRRLAEDLPENHRKPIEEWTENGRKLSLGATNYWKYHRRPERIGTEMGPTKDQKMVPSYTSLPKERKERERRAGPASLIDLNGSQQGFKVFWDAFPKKRNKGQAEKAWLQIEPDEVLLGMMLSKIEQARQTPEWQTKNGKFIPYPATWLNAKGWEDEYPAAVNLKERIPL